MRRFALILILALLPIGCDPSSGTVRPTHDQLVMREHLEEYRAKARSTGYYFDVSQYISQLVNAQGESKAEYPDMDWAKLNAEAEGMIDKLAASASGDPSKEANVTSLRAGLMLVTGRANEAIALVEGLHERAPSFQTAFSLIYTHVAAGVPMADAPGFCAAHRSLATDDTEVFLYLQACAELIPSGSIAESLAWASEADRELYAQTEARNQASEDEIDRLNRMDAERERELANSSSSSSTGSSDPGAGSSGSSGSAPSSVSITLRNTCPSTVKLFFGDKPGFGSGKYSSASSNTSTNMSFRPGDMIWIVDDSQKGVSSTTISASTRTIEITSSCTSLSSK